MSLDSYLIEKLDKGATVAQKYGVNLTTIHVAGMSTVLISSVACSIINHDPFNLLFNGTVWGCWLYGYQRWANQNKDYHVSVRLMEKLNSIALLERERPFTRYIWLFLSPLALGSALVSFFEHKILLGFFLLLFGLSPTFCWYLNCCFFIGPGRFASKRQHKVLSGTVYESF